MEENSLLNFPKSTEFNKRIPKQKFYENIAVTPAMKRAFVEQIRIIYWRNKIAATTLNLAAGEQVTEIEVFEVRLSAPKLDESVLRQIDREIPYHILFLLEYEGKYRAVIGYKEAAAGKTAFKVDRYYSTDWLDEDDLPVHLEGLTLDAVYENFVRQIAGDALGTGESASLKDSVEQQKQHEQLEKQVAALEAKIRKEKQPKKKFELVQQEYTENLTDDEYSYCQYNAEYARLYKKCRAYMNRVLNNTTPLAVNATELQEKFSSQYLSKQIELMLKMQSENPTDAIGKAKELIESCCKTILDNKGVAWDKNWNMGKLTGETLNLLNLTPESISENDPVSENIKAVLGNLRGISTKLAEIRNPYGSGHGKSASFAGLETRHAKLAVGCSITFVTFLWDTYEEGMS